MRVFTAQNIINLRDLGGYNANEGTTACRKIYRCGIPRDPSESDIKLLKELGIKAIIDLRGIREAEERPSVFKDDPYFDYYNISLLEANPALANRDIPIWEMYEMSLEDFSEGYRRVFKLLADINTTVLIHCFLGKDRTGILSALLLSVAGVCREDIIADYSASYDLFKDFVSREIENKTGLIWEQDISRLKSERVNIEKALDFIDNKYGSVMEYILSLGITPDEIKKVKALLI